MEPISNVKFPYHSFYHLCDCQGESLVFVQVMNAMGSGVNSGRKCGWPVTLHIPATILPAKSRQYALSGKTGAPNGGQNAWEERQISRPCRKSNHDSSDLPATYGLENIPELLGTVSVRGQVASQNSLRSSGYDYSHVIDVTTGVPCLFFRDRSPQIMLVSYRCVISSILYRRSGISNLLKPSGYFMYRQL